MLLGPLLVRAMIRFGLAERRTLQDLESPNDSPRGLLLGGAREVYPNVVALVREQDLLITPDLTGIPTTEWPGPTV